MDVQRRKEVGEDSEVNNKERKDRYNHRRFANNVYSSAFVNGVDTHLVQPARYVLSSQHVLSSQLCFPS